MSKHILTANNSSHLHYLISRKILQNNNTAYLIVLHNNSLIEQAQAELPLFLPPAVAQRLIFFPDWETLPYDHVNAHKTITARRMQALYQLTQSAQPIVITSALALQYRTIPVSFVVKENFQCHVGQKLGIEQFRNNMLAKGYDEVPEVCESGQFAIRGSILDVILTQHDECGYRIELFDDEVDSIRELDLSNNRSLRCRQSVHLQPQKEYLSHQQIKQVIEQQMHLCPEHLQSALLQMLAHVGQMHGVEYYLPFLHERMDDLFAYFQSPPCVILPENFHEIQQQQRQDTLERYQRHIDKHRPAVHPDYLLCGHELTNHADLTNYQINLERTVYAQLPNVMQNTDHQHPGLIDVVSHYPNIRLYANSPGRCENLKQSIDGVQTPCQYISCHTDTPHPHTIGIYCGKLRHGFVCPEQHTAWISENDLLGRISQNRTTRKSSSALDIDQIEDWQVGTLLVHRDYGIGKFEALTTMHRDGQDHDFLVLNYAGDDKLYVATSQFHLLTRYVGARGANSALSSLNGKKWTQKKQKAMDNADKLAEEILASHAKRQTIHAPTLSAPKQEYAMFCEYFPYTETEDQAKAITTVLADIAKPIAMNRLLCGDVGFGKTEVAMRAAFACAMSGHQVAMLAPTTLLAKQHFETFQQRFAHFPVTIHLLSRLQNHQAQTAVKVDIASGKADIIIATHSLLQSDIRFKHLGLLIVDEEHKFGVKQKELVKAISHQAHTLAMSATPIPRTLHMTLAKLRDMSIIATPPQNRQAIQTIIDVYSDRIVKEAILRECQRGGQCYVIHNDIRSLEIIKENLLRMLPHIRCRIMHAKQSKNLLEKTMGDFQQGVFDVLLATTIVESGIDIGNANTIIIQRADLLGLSQIHQLRGRVGRSHHQAYAYLLTPEPKTMTSEGRARMDTLKKQKQLGSGLNIALEDLEIRGAGDLLGKKQSGNVDEVGLSLYNLMLNQAARSRLGEKEEAQSSHIDIDLGLANTIPETYVQDFAKRLSYYRKISCAETHSSIMEIQHELEDRFGLIPERVKNLLRLRGYQQRCLALNITHLRRKEHYDELTFVCEATLRNALEQTQILDTQFRVIGKKIRVHHHNNPQNDLYYLQPPA